MGGLSDHRQEARGEQPDQNSAAFFDRFGDIQTCQRSFLHLHFELIVSACQDRNESAQLRLVPDDKDRVHIVRIDFLHKISEVTAGDKEFRGQGVFDAEIFPDKVAGLLCPDQRAGEDEVRFHPGSLKKMHDCLDLTLAKVAQGPVMILIK